MKFKKKGMTDAALRLRLLKLQDNHRTDLEIAKQFGISRQAIWQWRIKLGIAVADKHGKRNRTIRDLRILGQSVRSLCSAFHLSQSQVWRILNNT